MKKLLIFLFPLVLSSSCTSTIIKNSCHENEEFKNLFFSHIEYIESNISISQNEKFRESVIFMSNYVPVSLNRILNYSRTYPTGVFKNDKIKWIEWYQENKCKNIQLKASHSVPEVYRHQD